MPECVGTGGPEKEADSVRHLIGIGLAIGLAAAVFFAAGWGYLRLLRIPVVNGGASTLPANGGSLLHSATVLEAGAALAGTALIAGIFIAVRGISPLAAGLPGLALLAWTVVYGFSVRRAVHYIPLRGDAFGAGFEAMLFNGLLAAGGLALIVPLFIPSRWRSPAKSLSTASETGKLGLGSADDEDEASAEEHVTALLGDWAETAPRPGSESSRKGSDSYRD
jgi:hypothetical protein